MFGIREELLHPMLSHFPIVLLTLVAFIKPIEIIYKIRKKQNEVITIIALFLLYTAPLFSIMSLFLGDNSFDIIKHDICELTAAYYHEDMAHMTLYFLLGAVLIQVLIQSKKLIKHELLIEFILLGLIWTSSFYLFKTAHSGGELVYKHGAAVLNAKPCFE